MLIRQVEIYKSPIKLNEPFIISLGQIDYAENVIVVIRTDKGISGFGECSPFKTINGESIDTCFIVGQYLAKGLLNLDPLNIEGCSMRMNKTIYSNSSIKSAFDIALYDIASQNAGLPLYAFLGGRNNKQLVTDYTVSIGAPWKMAEDALKIKNNGFRIIKVKLGSSGAMDIDRIRSIRNAIGPELPIRIDANQGWNTDEAIETLSALSAYNIQFCEEPVPRWNYMDLPKIKKLSPVPIMADESCCDHHDAKRLIDIEACGYFNVKLGKSSGIFYALKIVQLAELADIKIQIGGFVESRLGFTASAHLALTSDNIEYCDFDTPLMLSEDHVLGGISYGNNGVVNVPEEPGLGACFDNNYLQSLTGVVVKE
jgi:L-alanine-DL-glutamate epimerase-like enolase superfamily enzyme